MAYIYQIINDINNKIYIGKTETNIEKRFKEHCRDAKKENCKNRPLYRAMNKYGIEHFHIELLEETENPIEREMYWIESKNSYHNGYNATLGGDGKSYIDQDLVINTYLRLKSQKGVSEELDIDVGTVHKILTNNKIEIVIPEKPSKSVDMLDKNNNLLLSFGSLGQAARYIIHQGLTSSSSVDKVSVTISRAVDQRKRKTAFGFIWKSHKDK